MVILYLPDILPYDLKSFCTTVSSRKYRYEEKGLPNMCIFVVSQDKGVYNVGLFVFSEEKGFHYVCQRVCVYVCVAAGVRECGTIGFNCLVHHGPLSGGGGEGGRTIPPSSSTA